MTTPYHLTARAAAFAALEAHANGELCAQTPKNEGAFYAFPHILGVGCAIGVAVPPDVAAAMQNAEGYLVRNMVERHGLLTTDDVDALERLQTTHDNWCGTDRNPADPDCRAELEQAFLATARAILESHPA